MKLNVNVGDKVILKNRYYETIEIVEKITPSGLIKIKGNYFYPNDGSERGVDVWNSSSIKEATEQDIAKIEERKIIRKTIEKMRRINSINYNQALEILKILDSEETK